MKVELVAAAIASLVVVLRIPAASAEEESSQKRTIEEIIVTAQKREQAIEEVPISIAVLDEHFIADRGITDLRDALLYVPNAKVEVAGFFAAPRIRGFTFNNNNKAFEPPAGLALDGVPYTRIGYFQSALFDVERVEVLRGPQGTTFGKNTTAGLISIVTKNPTDDYTGYVQGQLGDYGRQSGQAAVGGPLLKNLINFRLAALSDYQDGFVENTTAAIVPAAPNRERSRDNAGFRAKLGFPNLFGSQLVVSYELADLSDGGAGVELWHISPEVAAVLRRYDPNVDLVKGNWINSIDHPDQRGTKLQTLLGDWSYDLGGWSLHALAAHSIYKEHVDVDTDFTPAPALIGQSTDTSPTTTFELRTLSPSLPGLYGLERLFGLSLGRSDLLAGFFYQRRAINHSKFRFVFDDGPFLEITAAANSSAGLPVPPLPPGTSVSDSGILEDVEQFFDQSGTTIAGFSQMQWVFADRWTLQYGMRLSNETKKAHWHQVFNSVPRALLLAAGLREFTADQSISEFQFQPKATLEYTPFDHLNLFVHWARAFKGGGFNAFAFRGTNLDELVYKPESLTEWGFDAKTVFLDGAVRLNLSLYWMDVKDFQVLTRKKESTTIGLGVTSVVNAPHARARGVEGDLTWLATSWLSFIGAVGLNDTKYLDFTSNECPADASASQCVATGRSFFAAPHWDITFTPSVRLPLVAIPGIGKRMPSLLGGVDWLASFTTEYIDSYYPDTDLDRRKRQPSFFRYRASLGFGNAVQGWSFRVIGENLTNEYTVIRNGDLFAGVFVAASEPPRMIFGQFRWEF